MKASKSATKKTPHIMGWTVMSQLHLTVASGNRRLAVVLAPIPGSTTWLVSAVESSSTAKTLSDVFDEHAHQDLGKVEGMRKGIEVAETFAQQWQRGHQSPLGRGLGSKACPCPEIQKRVKKGAKRSK
jgi:hypothetical protein